MRKEVEYKSELKVIGEINPEMLVTFMEDTDDIIDAYKQYQEEISLIKDEFAVEFDRITIEISSYGGCTDCGSAMLDRIFEMQDMGIHVDTKCMGFAYSMAFILFIAGEKRRGGKFSKYMNHASSSSAYGFVDKMKNDIDFYSKCDEQFDNLILKQTNMPKERLEMAKLKNDWIMVDEAIELGIINCYEGHEESDEEIAEKYEKAMNRSIDVFGKMIGSDDEEENMNIMFEMLTYVFGVELVMKDDEEKEDKNEIDK